MEAIIPGFYRVMSGLYRDNGKVEASIWRFIQGL